MNSKACDLISGGEVWSQAMLMAFSTCYGSVSVSAGKFHGAGKEQ
jgi:hypothetical protein